MTKLLVCPAPLEVQRLTLGELTVAEIERLSEHILNCSACGQLLDSLQSASPLAADLRALEAVLPDVARADSLVDCNAIINACADSMTRAGSTDKIEPAASDEALALLEPPQGAGEIGRLGDYRILKVLGSGGMGIVFRAEDMRLKRTVALKVMKREAADKKGARERFLREAQLAVGLEHENIVTVYQVGEAGGVPFIAMQWLKGLTLEDYLRQESRVSTAEILRIGRQTASGLAAAHARGLVHCDIKPANLWLTETGQTERRVKILDFGLARALENELPLTQSGTLAYIAPERAKGQAADHRSDLFSLGVVLYRMATGRLPFEGANTLEMLNADIPPALSDLIMTLLEKDPDKRCSADELARALTHLEESYLQPKKTRTAMLIAIAALVLLAGAFAAYTLIFTRS